MDYFLIFLLLFCHFWSSITSVTIHFPCMVKTLWAFLSIYFIYFHCYMHNCNAQYLYLNENACLNVYSIKIKTCRCCWRRSRARPAGGAAVSQRAEVRKRCVFFFHYKVSAFTDRCVKFYRDGDCAKRWLRRSGARGAHHGPWFLGEDSGAARSFPCDEAERRVFPLDRV